MVLIYCYTQRLKSTVVTYNMWNCEELCRWGSVTMIVRVFLFIGELFIERPNIQSISRNNYECRVLIILSIFLVIKDWLKTRRLYFRHLMRMWYLSFHKYLPPSLSLWICVLDMWWFHGPCSLSSSSVISVEPTDKTPFETSVESLLLLTTYLAPSCH